MTIDCSNMKDFYSEKKRMCNQYECLHCPISMAMRGSGYVRCEDWILRYIDKAVSIVQKWSDEHQYMTYKEKLLLYFPIAKTKMLYSQRGICAGDLFGFQCQDIMTCEECWNTEVQAW